MPMMHSGVCRQRRARLPRWKTTRLCWAFAVLGAGFLGSDSLAFRAPAPARSADAGRTSSRSFAPPRRARVPSYVALRRAQNELEDDEREVLPSAAERRFSTLRVSTDLEEILSRVPKSQAVANPRLQTLLFLGPLVLNGYTLASRWYRTLRGKWEGFPVSALPWAEAIAFTIIVARAIWRLSRARHLNADLGYIPANNQRWRSAAQGARDLTFAAGFSAFKLLDCFRQLLPDLQTSWDLYYGRFKEEESPERLAIVRDILSVLYKGAWELCKGSIGLVAFFVELKEYSGSPIELLGLANQVVQITDPQEIELASMKRTVFTGEEAKWTFDDMEALAEFEGRLVKRCVRKTRGFVSGVASYALMGASDLQRLLIQEVPLDLPTANAES